MNFNFFGYEVEIQSNERRLKELLIIDFHFFQKTKETKTKLIIKASLKEDFSSFIPDGLVPKKQSINSMTFDQGHIRYNDYYGEAVTMFDWKINS